MPSGRSACTFAPSGRVCLKTHIADTSTEDIVDDINSDSPTSCGAWERLN
ncbi:MAG: hypothetical protein Q4D74_00915 [Comamonadaceae bacterium]|nr:hypothetical protein [Comamonadaceae bacterium]